MIGLPRTITDEDRLTGISCPDCYGVLTVRLERRGHLRLTCRIGHAFTLKELLAAKEDAVEDALWTTVVRLEELAGTLEDLDHASGDDRWQSRVTWLRHASRAMRQLNDQNQPVDLGRMENLRSGWERDDQRAADPS